MGSSTLDHLHLTAVLFGCNTFRDKEDKEDKDEAKNWNFIGFLTEFDKCYLEL